MDMRAFHKAYRRIGQDILWEIFATGSYSAKMHRALPGLPGVFNAMFDLDTMGVCTLSITPDSEPEHSIYSVKLNPGWTIEASDIDNSEVIAALAAIDPHAANPTLRACRKEMLKGIKAGRHATAVRVPC